MSKDVEIEDDEEAKDTPESEPEQSDQIVEEVAEGGAAVDQADHDRLRELTEAELDRLLEQYLHYGDVAIETANQRVQMNRFFGLILTSILAGLFALAQGGLTTFGASAVVFAAGFGSAVCYFWFKSLQSYRRLNKARYAIINKLESVLPAPLYLDEWRYLKRDKPDPEIIEPRGENASDHASHTIVELWFVRLLAAGYVTIGAYAIGFALTPLAAQMYSPVPDQAFVGIATGIIGIILMLILYLIRHH